MLWLKSMPTEQPSPRSCLFTVRLWVEEIGPDQHEVRMQVKHVLSGETRSFRQWQEEVTFILARLSNPQTEITANAGLPSSVHDQ